MDISSQSPDSISDEFDTSLSTQPRGETEEHIHMPNPSYWPLLVGIAVVAALGAVLFVPAVPWLPLLALPFLLYFIMGWALEDPMAPVQPTYREVKLDYGKYKISQGVVDSQGNWLGKIQARFQHYVLVERGHLLRKAYYVPESAIKGQTKNNIIILTLSEMNLVQMELNRVPDDLYGDVPEFEAPVVRGAPQFARRPLSPAETGHYNYGRRSPGINTDASGSYHRDEVRPTPQTYVVDDVYTTDEPIPVRAISPD